MGEPPSGIVETKTPPDGSGGGGGGGGYSALAVEFAAGSS